MRRETCTSSVIYGLFLSSDLEREEAIDGEAASCSVLPVGMHLACDPLGEGVRGLLSTGLVLLPSRAGCSELNPLFVHPQPALLL